MTDITIRALEACTTLAEAKELSRGMRETLIVVSNAHGENHPTTKVFRDRYENFVDEMAYRYNKGFLAA